MKKKNKIDYSYLSLMSHIGYSVLAPILVGLYIGGLIDEKIGPGWIFRIIFIVLGSVAGIFNIFQISEKYSKRKWALIKDLLAKISKVVVLLSIIIVSLMALLFKESKPLIMGYIFGATISILSLYLINDSINRFIRMEPARATKNARMNYFIRFIIYAAVLIVSALADYLNIFTTLLGLTMVKNSILLLNFMDKDFYKNW